MNDASKIDLASRIHAALSFPGVGGRTVQKALDAGVDVYDTDAFLTALSSVSTRIDPAILNESVYENVLGDSWELFEKASNDGQTIFIYSEEEYPSKLNQLKDPPLFLFAKGNVSLLDDEYENVAVVGSRKASDYGLKIAKRFGEVLAERGISSISGLAIGCDTYAHKGSLEKDGYTISVLPSSLDKVVPEQNRDLAESILSRRGLLVSEQLPGSIIDRRSFVQRNRIQAALSDKVVIIATSVDGGTMRTAEFAKRLKRPIGAFMFPEKYQDEDNEGNRELIGSGDAVGLYDASSIVKFLNNDNNSEAASQQLPLKL